jgi:SAM-dependent methyltransferase
VKLQQIESQQGEIAFRKKLAQQQVEGLNVFTDEYDPKVIETILHERMAKTLEQISALKEKGVTLSPYVEIGAERCQRSLVMENEIGAAGAAVDISFGMLKSCDYYRKLFNKNKTPLRICCDANNLPFASGSIPFVFCYETLHHFPDPTPIIKEIYRITFHGGYFFFDEEPYKRVLHLNLYKGKKIYSRESLNANKTRKIVDHFFAASYRHAHEACTNHQDILVKRCC